MLVHELLVEAEQEDGPERAVKFTNELRTIAKKHELLLVGVVKFHHQRAMQPARYDVSVSIAMRGGQADPTEQEIQLKLARREIDKWVNARCSEFGDPQAISTAVVDATATSKMIEIKGALSLPLNQQVRPQLSFQVFGYVLPKEQTEPLTGDYDELHDGKKPPYPFFGTRLSTTVANNGDLLMVKRMLDPNRTDDLPALQRLAIELASRYAPALAGKQMGVRRDKHTIPVSIITDGELADGFPVINSIKVNDASTRTVSIPPAEFRELFLRFFPKAHLTAK